MIKKVANQGFSAFALDLGGRFVSWFTFSYYHNNELEKFVSNIIHFHLVELSYFIVVFWVKICQNCHFFIFQVTM